MRRGLLLFTTAALLAGLAKYPAGADDSGAKSLAFKKAVFDVGLMSQYPSYVLGFPKLEDPDFWKIHADSLRSSGNAGLRYNSYKVSLLSQVDLTALGAGSNANDCAGYISPEGREYAIIGGYANTAFVEITDPKNPVVVAQIDDHDSLWSDMKTYGGYCYNVNESGGGVQVIDLRQIDQGVVKSVGNVTSNGLWTAHNIAVNPESGYVYPCGTNIAGGGFVAIDVNNPGSPVMRGTWSTTYVHDLQVVTYHDGPYAGKEIAFCACGWSRRLYIVDVTDKNNLKTISSLVYHGNANYPHSGGLSADRKYFFLNDELDENSGYGGNGPAGVIYVINVEDLQNPYLVTTFTNGNNAMDHNGEWRDGFYFRSCYSSGLRVFDVRDPMNIKEVGWFDTFPADDRRDFVGNWGVYVNFPSGVVIASDMQSGLFVLDVSEAIGAPQVYAPTAAVTLKGTQNSGNLTSLGADDGDYWVQGAAYDPTDPLAVINSVLQADTNASAATYSGGKVTVVEKSNSTNTLYRLRAVKANGQFVVLADNVPGSLTDVTVSASLPSPVSDFIDVANGNRLRLEIRNSSSNRLAGFFLHSTDMVQWELTP